MVYFYNAGKLVKLVLIICRSFFSLYRYDGLFSKKWSIFSCFLLVRRCFLVGEQQEHRSAHETAPSINLILCAGADSRFLLWVTVGSVWSVKISQRWNRHAITRQKNIPSLCDKYNWGALHHPFWLATNIISIQVLPNVVVLASCFQHWVDCAQTDFPAWVSEERKWSTHSDRGVRSCYNPGRLLHSEQLTLQQGSAPGKTCTKSAGCHEQSVDSELLNLCRRWCCKSF